MRPTIRFFALAGGIGLGLAVHAQSPGAFPPPAPTTKTAVGPWDAAIVEHAAAMLASPSQWNKADTDDCPVNAKTTSLRCALQVAVEEAAGVHRAASPPAAAAASAFTDCRFHAAGDGQEGTCGSLFDEVPVFTISPAKGITTGTWRKDLQPREVWAGKMSDAEYPVLYEARQVIDLVAAKKYAARLVDYNNDPATTFENLQTFFKTLEDRVIKNGAGDLDDATDDVEIEIYSDGAGVIRTYNGWYPVTGFAVKDSALQFRFDHDHEVPPNDLDRQILQRAVAIIASDAVWNRADNRRCPAGATTWSIYCAEEQATVEVTGAFHHRRPALELVREIVDERSKGKSYSHRLMDYNNDPQTTLADLKSLFAEALARIK
jgi:hypothetical protein